jgi:hypothetical protein
MTVACKFSFAGRKALNCCINFSTRPKNNLARKESALFSGYLCDAMNRRDTARLASAANVVSGRDGEQVSSLDCEAKIDAAAVSALIDFFKVLDKWDREVKQQ